MMPVGYMVNHPGGLQGAQGIGYDYLLCGNGVFVQSESALLRARICLAPIDVRGLAKVDEKVELVHGLIPVELFEQALRLMKLAYPRELLCTFIWQNGEYQLKLPDQTIGHASVQYASIEHVVLEIHSHGGMPAFFSATDNSDELGFHCYGVVGKLGDPKPQVNFRVGIFGHFAPVSWPKLFSGPVPAVTFKPFEGSDAIPPE